MKHPSAKGSKNVIAEEFLSEIHREILDFETPGMWHVQINWPPRLVT